ncbi:omega amino acid--pyruvate aminotransferase [Pandoraea thiooxydans]|uniref:Omega amino acid--pyruvate aminotransferase n=1 Tax=Pandoraea thiooxydans TaxID=445709 RepID=A0A0G3EQJ5_9BURK|nr:aspartate aminotransferase family protein [Pandoraea thiooxydans]AKJ68304.1 omega amino acid--pyruvate aminotransferase [Pandoraea thiooxydans]
MAALSNTLKLDRDELDTYWMPFTANRQFKAAPRLIASAEGMYYTDVDGRRLLDGIAGMWCCNAGHNRKPIVEAIQRQAAVLDFSPPFQVGQPLPFELANRLAGLAPASLNRVFFTNSGSESVDTALKIAIAYQRQRGQGTRTRLIGRERAYHGVGFGGISVGGIGANRRLFGPLLPGIDHLPHTHDLAHNAFSRGQPAWGAHLADDLERLVQLHDASTIAAVIVEPVAGSTGVLVPPKGYLERLREITHKYGIVLIFDEVITAFGRLGGSFAAGVLGVEPDIITTAKGLTSGTVPMGAVLVREEIYDAFMTGPENAIELTHGYTYSAHPLACAAALATLDLYRDEALFERAASLAGYWEDRLHALREARHVADLRNIGLIGAIELQPREGAPGARAFDVFLNCWERGLMIRTTGDVIALSPSLIIERGQIDELFSIVADALASTD